MAGEKVWIIDDEDTILIMLGKGFSAKGFNTMTFKTGTQALEVLAAGERPDAVLCDCFGAPSGEWRGMHIDEFYTQAAQYLGKADKYAMTGTPKKTEEAFGDLSRLGVRRVFGKPLPPLPEVASIIKQGIDERHADCYSEADN